MVLKEIRGDLFSEFDNPDVWFVQCISADFAMGKGIAVDFNEHFNTKAHIRAKFHDWTDYWDATDTPGSCIDDERTLNLVTKRNFWNKPTYKTLETSLKVAKAIILDKNIKVVAMPHIGCGLDRLEWECVKEILHKIFDGTDIEIRAYSLSA